MTIPSIIALEYPNKLEIYLGYNTLALGAGNCAGPLLGSLVSTKLDYVGSFLFFTVFIFTIGFCSILFVPSNINYSKIEQTT